MKSFTTVAVLVFLARRATARRYASPWVGRSRSMAFTFRCGQECRRRRDRGCSCCVQGLARRALMSRLAQGIPRAAARLARPVPQKSSSSHRTHISSGAIIPPSTSDSSPCSSLHARSGVPRIHFTGGHGKVATAKRLHGEGPPNGSHRLEERTRCRSPTSRAATATPFGESLH